jgi:restriction system protein
MKPLGSEQGLQVGLEQMPSQRALMWPTLVALRNLGGSGTIEEINAETLKVLNCPGEWAYTLRGSGPQTELSYRCAWARTRLRRAGLVDRIGHARWALTDLGTASEAEVEARSKGL